MSDRGREGRKSNAGYLHKFTRKQGPESVGFTDCAKMSHQLKPNVDVVEIHIHTDPWDPFFKSCQKHI